MTKKAQFMLVATILITISLFIIYTYIRSADTSSIIFFEPTSKEQFVNLHTSIAGRNAWLGNYWWDLNWQNRSTISISGTIVNPVKVDPLIPASYDCNQVRVVDSNNIEVPSSITVAIAPCYAVFNASAGIYNVYWNNPSATAPKTIGAGTLTGNLIRKEGAPTQLFCPHLVDMYKKAGVDINCSVQNIFSNNQVNYSIRFQSLDINFDGFLS
jgi:hypothetical protein